MKATVAGLALAVSLQGCITVTDMSTGVEGVYAVSWVKVEDPHKVCTELTGPSTLFLKTLGCVTRKDGLCTIYSRAPKDEMDTKLFAIVGHELMHCTDGDWHDKWGRALKKDAAGNYIPAS